MRIALFGGSFDPPHLGHVFAAVHARLVGQVDQVWAEPVAHHPYAKQLSPWQQRLIMTQAAFADLSFVTVREDELENPNGHTFSLVEHLQSAYPEHQWVLVGGSDTYADMGNWHRGSELQKMVTVHAVPRRGFDHTNPAALPELSSSLLRRLLSENLPVDGMLPSAVLNLIATNNWYQTAS